MARWNREEPLSIERLSFSKLIPAGSSAAKSLYDRIVGNTPLLNEIKQRRLEDMTARNQFLYANVLVGLSMLLQDKQSPKNNDENAASIEARIEETTRAMAPFMLALTGLGQQDLSEGDEIDGLEAATG